MSSALEDTFGYIDALFTKSGNDPRKLENAALLFVWVSKALVLRWHTSVQDIINKLITCVRNEIIGKYVTEHLALIVQDFDDCLNAKMHCKMRLMYKQRFLESIVPMLVEGYTNAVEAVKGNFLKAISRLLQQLPKQMLQKQIFEVRVCF